MKLSISIDMDNAAFEDDPGELGRILKTAGDKIEAHLGRTPDESFYCRLLDINGNRVGSASLLVETES